MARYPTTISNHIAATTGTNADDRNGGADDPQQASNSASPDPLGLTLDYVTVCDTTATP